MKTLNIGIASYDRMKTRTIAIARGEHKPAKDHGVGHLAAWSYSAGAGRRNPRHRLGTAIR